MRELATNVSWAPTRREKKKGGKRPLTTKQFTSRPESGMGKGWGSVYIGVKKKRKRTRSVGRGLLKNRSLEDGRRHGGRAWVAAAETKEEKGRGSVC